MNPLLIEPTDVLFFRDAVPMSAGQGKGAGCRLPFPSTLHEAFRANLLRLSGETTGAKQVEGRPRGAARKGNWHTSGHDGKTFIATRAFRSLRTVGPLPWMANRGLLLAIPADVATAPDGALARLQLWRDPGAATGNARPRPWDYPPPCLPMATTPPDKHGQLHGWWTTAQMRDYLAGHSGAEGHFKPTPTSDLWASEHRVGVQIDPGSSAAAAGQLYAGSYLRPDRQTRFLAWAAIADPAHARNGEAAARARERQQLDDLDWLLLGGESRLARLWHTTEDGQAIRDPLGALRAPPAPPPNDGPCLLKWILVTPALFAHGSLPGWCADSQKDRPGGPLPPGRVCLALPGRAQLVSWCLGKPRTVSGFDVVEGRAKPTLLAVPEGGVYYFLCENRTTAAALARALHWQPRSDFYGEKGCGYGLVSYDTRMHPASADLGVLAQEVFA